MISSPIVCSRIYDICNIIRWWKLGMAKKQVPPSSRTGKGIPWNKPGQGQKQSLHAETAGIGIHIFMPHHISTQPSNHFQSVIYEKIHCTFNCLPICHYYIKPIPHQFHCKFLIFGFSLNKTLFASRWHWSPVLKESSVLLSRFILSLFVFCSISLILSLAQKETLTMPILVTHCHP